MAGRTLLSALKLCAGGLAPGCGVVVGYPVEGVLRPVATALDRLDGGDVATLTEGRNRFVTSFLTEFKATEEQTADWLTHTVGPEDGKILFMFDNRQGRTIGYMGLDFIDWERRYAEADSVVRVADDSPGSMAMGLQTLLVWARAQLGIRNFGVRVRSDNLRGMRFYQRIGYEEVSRVPLVLVQREGLRRWVEDSTASGASMSLVHMRWRG